MFLLQRILRMYKNVFIYLSPHSALSSLSHTAEYMSLCVHSGECCVTPFDMITHSRISDFWTDICHVPGDKHI